MLKIKHWLLKMEKKRSEDFINRHVLYCQRLEKELWMNFVTDISNTGMLGSRDNK